MEAQRGFLIVQITLTLPFFLVRTLVSFLQQLKLPAVRLLIVALQVAPPKFGFVLEK